VGFVVDKVALGQVFSKYFGFPCQFSFHRLLHTHHLSSGAGTIGQIVADIPSGLSLTPPQETKKKQLNNSVKFAVNRTMTVAMTNFEARPQVFVESKNNSLLIRYKSL
jgi:hypothetical protein